MESLVTLGAGVLLLPQVSFDMWPQASSLGKSLFTLRAGERLLSWVSPAVSLQFTGAREGLVTNLAYVVHGRQQAGSYWSSSARITYLTPTDDKACTWARWFKTILFYRLYPWASRIVSSGKSAPKNISIEEVWQKKFTQNWTHTLISDGSSLQQKHSTNKTSIVIFFCCFCYFYFFFYSGIFSYNLWKF